MNTIIVTSTRAKDIDHDSDHTYILQLLLPIIIVISCVIGYVAVMLRCMSKEKLDIYSINEKTILLEE